jgi:hypothetical protein
MGILKLVVVEVLAIAGELNTTMTQSKLIKKLSKI